MSSLGVLSLALFSCACLPNFHHKHLTPTDPLLSVCEEALVSLLTRADRHKILQLCTNVHFVCVCVCALKVSVSEQWRTALNALIILLQLSLSCCSEYLSVLARLQADRSLPSPSFEESLSWRRDSVLSLLFFPLLHIRFIFSSVLGSDEERKANEVGGA